MNINRINASKKNPGQNQSFKGLRPSKSDLAYKDLLRQGIKDTFSLDCKIEDLEAVLGPDELRSLLKRLIPMDYKTGPRVRNKFPDLSTFSNVISGRYKANFHLHSNKSDGTLKPEEILNQAQIYAQKSAKKTLSRDIPPFSFALTDHDNFEGAKEILALISQDPKKYKNIKYSAGSEFYFTAPNSPFGNIGFEAVGLSFNPFDTKLNQELNPFRHLPAGNTLEYIKTIKDAGGTLSFAHPFINRKKDFSKEFVRFLKEKGIEGVETNYQYIDFMHFDELIKTKKEIRKISNSENMLNTGGTDSHTTNIFGKFSTDFIDLLMG